jgi:hypothetical protein
MDGGLMFNKAGHFMGSFVVPRVLEIGLFVGIFLHIIQGYMLTLENRSKRKIGYEVNYSKGSKWYSRSMAILGTLLLMFLIMHIYHFWTPSRLGGIGNIKTLNTVILASPRKKVEQSVGRILRERPEERKVLPLILDIVDSHGIYTGQWRKRRAFYKACGYNLQFETYKTNDTSEDSESETEPLNIKGGCVIVEED